MAENFVFSSRQRIAVSLKFREASADLLNDLLINCNERNKENLNSLPVCIGSFKQKTLIEHVFLITEKLKLDPLVGYQAVELLQRFMVKHLSDMFTAPEPQGATVAESANYEEAVFHKLKDKIPLILLSCVQLASKQFFHYQMIDTNAAVRFLQSAGIRVSKQAVLESELMVFKGLEFKLNVPNPLIYVEILLEVLGHNEPSIPVEHIYKMGRHVLQFILLERTAVYETLLRITTQCGSPSQEQRMKFLTVTEDCMLLGVCVIAVATFILLFKKWQQIFALWLQPLYKSAQEEEAKIHEYPQVVCELSHITGISKRSIRDFAQVTLVHIIGTSSSEKASLFW